ncbi:MAG: hypothetical protein NTY48_02925 [Candidatus Diapherotrites archaeon]|nr:hypothetical protein [Candidatus Diapherotrites archaeon]
MKFVKSEETVLHSKSHNYYLDLVMAEILENSTLAHWVRETNEKLSIRNY